jgi:hypothetical protein
MGRGGDGQRWWIRWTVDTVVVDKCGGYGNGYGCGYGSGYSGGYGGGGHGGSGYGNGQRWWARDFLLGKRRREPLRRRLVHPTHVSQL